MRSVVWFCLVACSTTHIEPAETGVPPVPDATVDALDDVQVIPDAGDEPDVEQPPSYPPALWSKSFDSPDKPLVTESGGIFLAYVEESGIYSLPVVKGFGIGTGTQYSGVCQPAYYQGTAILEGLSPTFYVDVGGSGTSTKNANAFIHNCVPQGSTIAATVLQDTTNITPPPRIRQSVMNGNAITWDSLTENNGDTVVLQPIAAGSVYIRHKAGTTYKFHLLSGAAGVQFDSVTEVGGKVYVAGRFDGPSFDFAQGYGISGSVSGSGYFIAQYGTGSAPLPLEWLKIIGGTPPLKATAGHTAAPGTGANFGFGEGASALYVTIPFSGTLDFGSGTTVSSPTGQQATAVAALSYSDGKPIFAMAFGKGPKATGKLSRPMLAVRKITDEIVLADTVWDTVDIKGKTVNAKAGADVYVAWFNASHTLTQVRVYGGPGDDEASGAVVIPSSKNVAVAGHSATSIDFGNGALTPTGSGGEAWVAELVP